MISCFLAGPDDTSGWADIFADACAQFLLDQSQNAVTDACVVALEGSLGAGKSHLCRAMLRAWGISGVIPSPTYSLLEEYPDAKLGVAHMDWYRLGDALELEMLDWDGLKARCGVILVEWASRLPEMHDSLDIVLEISVPPAHQTDQNEADFGAGRILRCRSLSPRGRHLLTKIQPKLEDSRAGQ